MSPLQAVEPARSDEMADVFRLVFQHSPSQDREARVANALRLVRNGDLNPNGILAARNGTELLGAIVCLPVPGASGLIWPPQTALTHLRSAVEDELIRRACRWLRTQGARMAQALLNPAEIRLGDSLLRNGFAHITSLWYLRHPLDLSAPLLAVDEQLTLRPYLEDPDTFQQTLLRTYEETADCPEVSGVRTIDEILEGHQAQGKYDPGRWWLALANGQAIGVLLLTELPDLDSWDISYVGVVPQARRQGFGRTLTTRALFEAKVGEAAQLTLSVDRRNRAAWNLYRSLGFEPFERREVFLAIWDRADS